LKQIAPFYIAPALENLGDLKAIAIFAAIVGASSGLVVVTIVGSTLEALAGEGIGRLKKRSVMLVGVDGCIAAEFFRGFRFLFATKVFSRPDMSTFFFSLIVL
jgi:hypothetical protein